MNGLIYSFESYQTNIQLINNRFHSNYATQSGGVLSFRSMRQQTSALNIVNNTFTNNRCGQNGGVYSFILTDYKIASGNNTYINNTAGLSGGVGYGLRASFVFFEEDGVYLNNTAGSFGGTWYISFNNYKTNLQSFGFSQTSFISSLAQSMLFLELFLKKILLGGGSIYLEAGSLTFNQCIFKVYFHS